MITGTPVDSSKISSIKGYSMNLADRLNFNSCSGSFLNNTCPEVNIASDMSMHSLFDLIFKPRNTSQQVLLQEKPSNLFRFSSSLEHLIGRGFYLLIREGVWIGLFMHPKMICLNDVIIDAYNMH